MRKKHRGKQIDFFFAGRPNYRAGINNYWSTDRHASVMHCNGPWGVNASFFCLTCCCGTFTAQWASLIIQMFSCSGMLMWHGLFSSHFCVLLIFTFFLYVPKTNRQAHFEHILLQPKGQQTFLQTADMLRFNISLCYNYTFVSAHHRYIHTYVSRAMYDIDSCTCLLEDFRVWRGRVVVSS